ncbi:MAG: hypothetical protein EXS19_04920 [Pedosphaera sp.]|nr:hypothetical protein [Pedosphaera sp.]MSU41237.1 hypothetical protein [Pedosphaera sp.]
MMLIEPFKKTRVQWSPSVWVLILANLIPLVGVLYFGWAQFPIMFLFWMENVVVGVFNVLKMVWSGGVREQHLIKWMMVPFFCMHYGIFTLVHGFFVFALFGAGQSTSNNVGMVFQQLRDLLFGQGIGWAVLVLVASHGFSFVWNYILNGEYRTTNAISLMIQPYGRVVVLHMAILGSGFLITYIGSPKAGLALLVILKIALDVKAHAKEHSLGKTKTPAQETWPPSAPLQNG